MSSPHHLDPPPTIDHLAHLAADAERLSVIVATGPLDAPVAACPGWDLRALVAHVGRVHRWAQVAARTAERPQGLDATPPAGDGPELAAWLREGAAALLTTLRELDPGAPTWHPFPAPQVAGLWRRRQAHETVVHRWDAEQAVGALTPIAPDLASDGIDEYFGLIVPNVVRRTGPVLPRSTLHVHCTDTHGEWLVTADDDAIVMTREHAKGDAALRGPAEGLLLRLWRRPAADDNVEVIGSAEAAAEWLALGGA